MFIGRERELNALERLYQSNKFEFAAICGRCRVGKTALINKFIDDRNAIYFMGVESDAKQNLKNLSASTLQLLIDKYKDKSKLMLILCGSSMSYMKDYVLAYKAPLYGRRTAQIKLMPFDFEETCRYFKNFSDENNMFRFRYRFVFENNSIVARGAADLVYKRIEPQLPDYMGKVFEEICRQYLYRPLVG